MTNRKQTRNSYPRARRTTDEIAAASAEGSDANAEPTNEDGSGVTWRRQLALARSRAPTEPDIWRQCRAATADSASS